MTTDTVLLFPIACVPGGAGSMQGGGASVPAAASVSAIPGAFHGTWTHYSSGVHLPGEDPVQISATTVTGHEEYGQVSSVRVHGPTDITVTLALSGEGQEWKGTRRYTLTSDGALNVAEGRYQQRLVRAR